DARRGPRAGCRRNRDPRRPPPDQRRGLAAPRRRVSRHGPHLGRRGGTPSSARGAPGMTRRRVAVLGAGIMGASTALHLARLGVPVTVFDHENAPFRGASRWNEGKIHLGFLYAADPTLDTARAVLPGGLDFKDQVEALTAIALGPVTTTGDDLYLLHRDSVTAPHAASRYFTAVAELVRSHPEAHRY